MYRGRRIRVELNANFRFVRFCELKKNTRIIGIFDENTAPTFLISSRLEDLQHDPSGLFVSRIAPARCLASVQRPDFQELNGPSPVHSGFRRLHSGCSDFVSLAKIDDPGDRVKPAFTGVARVSDAHLTGRPRLSDEPCPSGACSPLP